MSADKILIESIIVKLTLEGNILNKKNLQGLDLFYNSAKVIDNIQHDSSQNHCINSGDLSSSILSETSPSIGSNLQTPIRESSITKSDDVPENQTNIENPFDNSVFKKTLNIFIQIIDTFKRRPEYATLFENSQA